MPRYTRQAFWCGTCHSRNEGDARHCSNCGTDAIERHAPPRQRAHGLLPPSADRRDPAPGAGQTSRCQPNISGRDFSAKR